jgi:hypothetical protein
MPKSEEDQQQGSPRCAESTPAKMLSTSTLPSKISWWLASAA